MVVSDVICDIPTQKPPFPSLPFYLFFLVGGGRDACPRKIASGPVEILLAWSVINH